MVTEHKISTPPTNGAGGVIGPKMSTRSSTGALPPKVDRDAMDGSVRQESWQQQQQQRDEAREPCHDSPMSDRSAGQREASPTSPDQITAGEEQQQQQAVEAAAVEIAKEYQAAAVANNNKAGARSSTRHKGASRAQAARAKNTKKKAGQSAKQSSQQSSQQFGMEAATTIARSATPIMTGASSILYQDAGLVKIPSFDPLGPSTSFGGLSALGLDPPSSVVTTTQPMTNLLGAGTPTSNSSSGGRHHGHQGHFRHPSSSGGTTAAVHQLLPANLPMSELDNPSWDLLNQDSFGFNLLGDSQDGSLSFEAVDVAADGSDNNNKMQQQQESGGREREGKAESVDLTCAVTLSLDDNNRMEWTTAPPPPPPPTAVADNGLIVNSMNHNWIPSYQDNRPYHPSQHAHHNAHHAHQHHHHYPIHHGHHHHQPLQESRSDIPHPSQQQHGGYHYNLDPTELRDTPFDVDPFKYAFGDPRAAVTDVMGAGGDDYTFPPPPPLLDKNSRRRGGAKTKSSSSRRERSSSMGGNIDRSASGGRGSSPKNPRTSTTKSRGGTTKKRKQPQQGGEEPLDGHESPPALPTIESAPTATLEMAWSASPSTPHQRKSSRSDRSKSSRGGRSDGQHSSSCHRGHQPDVGRSSTWHAAPAPGPHRPRPHGCPPYMPPIGADPIHSAFLPPMPTQPPPPPYPPPNNSNALPREVYITTKSSSGGGGAGAGAMVKPANVASAFMPPQFPMAPQFTYPPPHPAPTGNNGSKSNDSSVQPPLGKATASSSALSKQQRTPMSMAPAMALPPQPQQKGMALLALPNGQQLSRSQAPGIGWPPEEDVRLTEVMSNHKSSSVNWESLCVEHGVGRTARECHDRWTRYLKPGSRKGQWREEEDAIVLKVIFSTGGSSSSAEHRASAEEGNEEPHYTPFTQWADLAPQLPGRTGKQIRDRWVNYLNPAINHLPFSREDDLRLWQGHKELGKRWVEISVKIFHSTRSENHIKNRWYSAAFKKFIAKEFGMDAYVDAKQAQGSMGSMTPRDHHLGSQQQQQHCHHGQGLVKQQVVQVGGKMNRNGVLRLHSTTMTTATKY